MDCIEGNVLVLSQIDHLLGQVDSEAYARPLELYNGSTIGQHLRHILDFYQALLRGVENGLIDYANRERDPLVEKDPGFARQVFQRISRDIMTLEESRHLPVRADFFPDESIIRPTVQSSVGRELMFAFDHAVHHLAMVKIGLRVVQPGIMLDEELGVAPSTIKYQKSRRATAPK